MNTSAESSDNSLEPPDWRGKAHELFPELEEEIDESATPMNLWTAIWLEFVPSYGQPRNDDFIARAYAYADWCLLQPQSPEADAANDLPTCVVTCFWEDIPRHPAARADMPRWFTRQNILDGEVFFRYHLSDTEWQDLLSLYADEYTAPVNTACSLSSQKLL